MSRFGSALAAAFDAPNNIATNDLAAMLACDDESFEDELFAAAREMKARCGLVETLPRGLVECSNVCSKDCLYCGIRCGNASVARYRMSVDEVLGCVGEAVRRGYPAVAFQAGEVESEDNTSFYETVLARLPQSPRLEVTLSLGEQSDDVLRRWKVAAGNRILRYLLRIETSDRGIFGRIHPSATAFERRRHSFERRVGCIRSLKRFGYVTGSGVMIGLPGQGSADLAHDIVFFGDERLDMVGMGPYIPHPATPLGSTAAADRAADAAKLRLSLRMIALTRLYLHDINIVAATALEALDPERGRERGLQAGANVIMPDLTPERYKVGYDLYPGKATVD